MLLAAVQLHPMYSLPVAAAVAAWIVWYWIRLGRPEVPQTRRKIRRFSLVMMAVGLFLFVRALSFIDPNQQPQHALMTWMLAIFVLLVVIVAAGLDALNSLRLVQKQTHEEMHQAAADLSKAIKERQSAKIVSPHHRPSPNGERRR